MSFTVPKPKSGVHSYPVELKTVGDHIRKKRLDEELSQTQLARKLNIRKGRIWAWERNIKAPTPSIYPVIIEFLGYDPLFDDSGTLQADIENYRRKHGVTYMQLAKDIDISYVCLMQYVNHENGSEKTIETLQTFFEEPSE